MKKEKKVKQAMAVVTFRADVELLRVLAELEVVLGDTVKKNKRSYVIRKALQEAYERWKI